MADNETGWGAVAASFVLWAAIPRFFVRGLSIAETVVHGNTRKRIDVHKWFEKNVYLLCDDVKRMLLYFMHRELNRQTLNPEKIEQHLFENGILGLDLPEGS